MCMTLSAVHRLGKWNWNGDTIIHDPIVRDARTVPSSRTSYDLDIREFLLTEGNAVIRRTLGELIEELPVEERTLIRSRLPGSFDLRAREVLSYVSKRIPYKAGRKTLDAWLFPDETLAARAGDCEDRAFLLAALLLGSGISPYNVRVALGKFYQPANRTSGDHVWVMYKNEDGLWMCLEPQLFEPNARRVAGTTVPTGSPEVNSCEYIPYFVFNNHHLWSVRGNADEGRFEAFLKGRKPLTRFSPAFAAALHNQIIDAALPDIGWTKRMYLKAYSLAIDTVLTYNPADHFDNGYIVEGWGVVRAALARKTLNGLANAVHTVADFYAHTSYAHFAPQANGQLTLFDESFRFPRPVSYDGGSFNVGAQSPFTVNTGLMKEARNRAVPLCNQWQIISGRFAQPNDPAQSWLERTFVEIPYALRHGKNFADRAVLPHHDEMSVDAPLKGKSLPERHRLYRSSEEYMSQFHLRRNAAVRHIAQLYSRWK